MHQAVSRLSNASRARLSRVSLPETQSTYALAQLLLRHGFISAIHRGDHLGPDPHPTPTTNLNRATRRYWLDMRYDENGAPVLGRAECISKPSRTVVASVSDLRQLVQGRDLSARGIRRMEAGQVMVVAVAALGMVDIWEAVKAGQGGQLVCRLA